MSKSSFSVRLLSQLQAIFCSYLYVKIKHTEKTSMLPGEIRRYKQSSFPLWSSFVDCGLTGQNSQTSSFPRLPGNGGKLETRLPRLGNQVSLVAVSQEARNAIVPKNQQSAKYATSARRERAPDRTHENKGKRSSGIVDSDLYHKIGQVGGQNSKPLSRQKSRRKPGHKRDKSSPTTLDENERSSLENMKHDNRKHFVTKRRHKSHVRESPYAAHQAGKVDQGHRIKSCDRSLSKTNKSLSEVKDELRQQCREISLKESEISMKKKQRKADHILAEKVNTVPVATKPRSEKRWKCILVRHSKKSTPMWVGNIPAESWEDECKSANNISKLNSINTKTETAETVVTKNRYTSKLKKPEAREGALDSTSKDTRKETAETEVTKNRYTSKLKKPEAREGALDSTSKGTRKETAETEVTKNRYNSKLKKPEAREGALDSTSKDTRKETAETEVTKNRYTSKLKKPEAREGALDSTSKDTRKETAETEVTKNRYTNKLKKPEARGGALDSTSKEASSTDQPVSKGSSRKYMKLEGATEVNKNIKIRRHRDQNDKIKTEQFAKKVKGINKLTTSSANEFHLSDTKMKRLKAAENIKTEKTLNNVKKRDQSQRENELKKELCLKSISKQGDNRDIEHSKNLYKCIKKQNKGKNVSVVQENADDRESKIVKEKNKTEQSDHKNKQTREKKTKFDEHEKKSSKLDELPKTIRKADDKEKTTRLRKACRTDAVNTDKKKTQMCSPKSKDPMALIEMKSKKLNSETTQTATQGSTKSSFSSSKNKVSNKHMNIKSNEKLNNRASKLSTLDRFPTTISKTPFSDRQTRRPVSSKSASSKHSSNTTRRHVTDISIENSSDKNNIREKFGQKSGTSMKTIGEGLRTFSTPKLLQKTVTTEMTNTPKRNRGISSTKTHTKSETRVPVRSTSRVSSEVSVRSNATKSIASVHGCQGLCKSTNSSHSVFTVSPQRPKTAAGSHCSSVRKQQEPVRPSSDCGRPVSAKTISRIPVPSKSISSVSVRQKTKSASLPSISTAEVKPLTSVHRRPSSSNTGTYVSTRSNTAIPESLTPVSCRDFTAAAERPVLRCESSTSAKFKSAIPVPKRRGSPISDRTTVSSAARSSRATSRKSVSSAGHVSVKSSPSSIHTYISRASSVSSVRSGKSSNTEQASRSSERVQSGRSSVTMQSSRSSVKVQSSPNSVIVQSSHSSVIVQSGRSSVTAQSGHSSVSTYEDDFEHESFSSCRSRPMSDD